MVTWYHGCMSALTVRLPEDVHEGLRRAAYITRTPMAQLIADALRKDLARFIQGQTDGTKVD